MDGPVSGFGVAGKDYLRLSAFNRRHNVQKAVHRLLNVVG